MKNQFKGQAKDKFRSNDKGKVKGYTQTEKHNGFKKNDKCSFKTDRQKDKPYFKEEKRELKREFKREEKARERSNYENNSPKQTEDSLKLVGRQAVLEALNHDKPIDKILIKSGEIEGTLKVVVAKARDRGIPVKEVSRVKLDEMTFHANHQGVLALCPAAAYSTIDDMLELAKKKGEQPFIIVLDEITDPHNLGAIIRTAEAASAHGVIIPKNRAAGLTFTVSKTSAGALNHVPVAKVTNITQAIDELKKKGLWVYCADMNGEPIFKTDFKGAVALVIGNEGAGVPRLVREKCDFVVNIPMYGKIGSLNASVAAGVLMYEVVRNRRFNDR